MSLPNPGRFRRVEELHCLKDPTSARADELLRMLGSDDAGLRAFEDGLRDPTRRGRLLRCLLVPSAASLRVALVPVLLEIASHEHAHLDTNRQVLHLVPAEALGSSWEIVLPLLESGDWEEPRRLAELFVELALLQPMRALVAWCESSGNPDVQEVASDLAVAWDKSIWGLPISEWPPDPYIPREWQER